MAIIVADTSDRLYGDSVKASQVTESGDSAADTEGSTHSTDFQALW